MRALEKRRRFVLLLLYAIVTLIFVSFVPIVFRSSAYYGVVHRAIMALVLLLSVMSISNGNFLSNKFFLGFIVLIGITGLMFLVFMSQHFHYNMGDFTQLIIVLLSLVIGYSLTLSDKQLTYLCVVYCAAAIIVGYLAVVSYTGVFSFEGNRNLIDGKNLIGGLVAVAGAVSVFLFSMDPKKKWLIVLFALAFIVSALIRARAAFVAFVFLGMLIALKKFPFYKVLISAIILVFVYIIFSSQIDSFLMGSLVGRGGLNIDDLSTGRAERNRLGLQYLSENFWTGELYGESDLPWIHNYLLLRLVRYGFWGSIFIFIYFYFLAKLVKEFFSVKEMKMSDIGLFLPIIPFIVSLVEPSYPFGPGTVQFFVYVLFGFYLRQKQYRV